LLRLFVACEEYRPTLEAGVRENRKKFPNNQGLAIRIPDFAPSPIIDTGNFPPASRNLKTAVLPVSTALKPAGFVMKGGVTYRDELAGRL
jgi:hypothetical protein